MPALPHRLCVCVIMLLPPAHFASCKSQFWKPDSSPGLTHAPFGLKQRQSQPTGVNAAPLSSLYLRLHTPPAVSSLRPGELRAISRCDWSRTSLRPSGRPSVNIGVMERRGISPYLRNMRSAMLRPDESDNYRLCVCGESINNSLHFAVRLQRCRTTGT